MPSSYHWDYQLPTDTQDSKFPLYLPDLPVEKSLGYQKLVGFLGNFWWQTGGVGTIANQSYGGVYHTLCLWLQSWLKAAGSLDGSLMTDAGERTKELDSGHTQFPLVSMVAESAGHFAKLSLSDHDLLKAPWKLSTFLMVKHTSHSSSPPLHLVAGTKCSYLSSAMPV